MDHKIVEFQSRRSNSSDRASCASSRRFSASSSFASRPPIDVDNDCEVLSEAGDIGDRALYRNRCSGSGRVHFTSDTVVENRMVLPIQEDIPCTKPMTPSTLGIITPFPTVSLLQSEVKYKSDEEVPWLLEYVTCLLSLAVFGILGVLARYGLQKLFGPEIVGATNDQSYMYPDLPSNMVGSFLMGWFGVVFKGDISKISDQLAIGLTTGFLGSLTTFSGWNQKMLDLSVNDKWVFSVLGILIGLLLVAGSISFGIETAKGFKWLYNETLFEILPECTGACIANKSLCIWTFTLMLTLILGLLWGVFGYLAGKEFNTGSNEAKLFLACLVAPFGVWIRWLLARFNGKGLGKNGKLKWLPFGTLAANVLAACIMAGLDTLKKEVRTETCDTAATGIQFGFLGCLSTVSTFIAEFHAMRQSSHVWRSYAYAAMTFIISFLLGTLIYSVPVWTKRYA